MSPRFMTTSLGSLEMVRKQYSSRGREPAHSLAEGGPGYATETGAKHNRSEEAR